MTSEVSAREALYRLLLRNCYLLLAPQRDPRLRGRRAHRLADNALSRRVANAEVIPDELYWKLLRRIVRQTHSPWALLGVTNWARVRTEPGDVEQLVLDAHLAAASPAARIGFLLLVAEELTPEEAAAKATALRLRVEGDVVAEGITLQERVAGVGIGPRRQRELLDEPPYAEVAAAQPPTATRLRLRSVSRLSVGIVSVVAVLLLSFVLLPQTRDRVTSSSNSSAVSPTVQRVSAADWTGAK
ncbi:MAG: hypothetical protein ACRDTD_30845, partial [Pseudonocardiaceae bacterium]